MASKTTGNRKKNNQRRKTSGSRKTSANRKTSAKKKSSGRRNETDFIADEVKILIVLAVCVLLLLSNFGLGGAAGRYVSGLLFGLFGAMAWAIPVALFIGTAFGISNRGNKNAKIKTGAGIGFTISFCAFLQMITVIFNIRDSMTDIFVWCMERRRGGGLIGGAIVRILHPVFGAAGSYVIIIVALIICLVLITQRSFLGGVKKGSSKVYETARVDAQRRKERSEEKKIRREEQQATRGVSFAATTLPKKAGSKADIHEVKPKKTAPPGDEDFPIKHSTPLPVMETEPELAAAPPENDGIYAQEQREQTDATTLMDTPDAAAEAETSPKRKRRTRQSAAEVAAGTRAVQEQIDNGSNNGGKEHKLPPLSLLKKSRSRGAATSDAQLRETARTLEETLREFGVAVTITNVTCGPAVTRYELQPAQGVKVSKIVSLADDIKLNLAAADIRMEAPIPGKRAVGIEVPNAEKNTIMLRDMLESQEFMDHQSKLACAIGRDIAGNTIVADIMKMPHLLIAGATGSGKSVCVNTLIMSILYKASPDEVKLIMIDPKMVEMGIYNGIPHMLIPVVTDPKKAAGALEWAVREMTERYQKFADLNVRDLKGYNEKIASVEPADGADAPEKMPQIVIVVDEFADLMMVAKGEVEDAVCRLAQLARAAGIHMILATQRPSVNVITGLIKANMPSRIALSVSSGVDSRTIIDMNGAEKLLGNGDMLFYPSGYQKPVRVQGAYVSEAEISKVVSFLKDQYGTAVYNEEVEEKVSQQAVDAPGSGDVPDERDIHFVAAGKFIIEKDKASIGMLQRMFKIGFNRAARLMDQLAKAGVVGEEDGTKPRKVLMSMEEFEKYIEEYL